MGDLDQIINAIESGKCLAFIGAGAGASYNDPNGNEIKGLPLGAQLAESLAKKCGYSNGNFYDLLKVSEYFLYSRSGDRESLENAIRAEIQNSCQPRPIHTVLAQLKKVKVFITSNYDTLLEQELRKYRTFIKKHVHNPLNPKTAHFECSPFLEEDEAVLHKMHGDLEEPGSMVVTQSDYIRYLANLSNPDRGMPEYFWKTMLPYCTILFLGYSLNDWNFQVIWEGVMSGYVGRNIKKTSYAFVKRSDPQQINYWARNYVEVYNRDLTDVAVLLAQRFNLEIPQMEIKKKQEGGKP